jgi:hypothetical protein
MRLFSSRQRAVPPMFLWAMGRISSAGHARASNRSENYKACFLFSLSGGAPRQPRSSTCCRFPSGRARPPRAKRKDEGLSVVASRLLLRPVCLLSFVLHCLRFVSKLEAIIVLVPIVAVDALTVIMTIDA